jgi:division protein CdvB (Snf7/Vps24/ESCRT-III family)
MTTKKYIQAQGLMNRIESIETAIEYMETVQCSKECMEAVVDMLKYDQRSLYDEFAKI